jgi:threonylcarbamoyladenosine tRNA methylthiotransferase MtaB
VKVYLRTFGCRANQYDTEAVRAMLLTSGHTIAASPIDADVAVFNSCAVTSEAEAELRKEVRRGARQQPALRSIVMGCAASLDADRPGSTQIARLPSVEHVVAGGDLPAVAAALELDLDVAAVRTNIQTGTRALLRIQDGCDEHCTFCATTMARGASRSREPGQIVREAIALAEHHAEIVITGIHIGTFGHDIGTSLGDLLVRLVREVPTARFRLSSIEATEIGAALSDLLSGCPRHVVPHVHAPLQSGSDRLLRRMGRHWYTAGTYASAVGRLAATMPILGLGADLIAGFPGETEADHAATMQLVDRLPFTYLHVFPYSARPGTAAVQLPGQVPSVTSRRRARELRELGARKAANYVSHRAGGPVDVIVLGGQRSREGLTGDYLTVVPSDPALPRGTRFDGRLVVEADRLLALRSE